MEALKGCFREMDLVADFTSGPLLFIDIDRNLGIAALRTSATTASKTIRRDVLDAGRYSASVRSYDAFSMRRVHQLPIHLQSFTHEPNQIGPSEQCQNDARRNLRRRENDAAHSITKCEQHAAQQKSTRH